MRNMRMAIIGLLIFTFCLTPIWADDTAKLNSYQKALVYKQRAETAGQVGIWYAHNSTLNMLTAIYHQNKQIIQLLRDLNEKADKQKTK